MAVSPQAYGAGMTDDGDDVLGGVLMAETKR